MTKFYRDKSNKVLGGVISGIAKSYDINVDITILRIIAGAMLVFSEINTIIFVAYLLAWFLTPEKDFSK